MVSLPPVGVLELCAVRRTFDKSRVVKTAESNVSSSLEFIPALFFRWIIFGKYVRCP